MLTLIRVLTVSMIILAPWSQANSELPQQPPPTVVLLTSLKNSDHSFLRSKHWTIQNQLESILRRRFKDSGFRILVRHDVDGFDVWTTLHQPENVAVYYLAHAAAESSIAVGNELPGIISDINGRDIKYAFTEIHPNLRWLSVIGCDAESVIADFVRRGLYRNNPKLRIQSFNKKVDARQGLELAIDESTQILSDYPAHRGTLFGTERPPISPPALLLGDLQSPCPFLEGIPITITRTLDPSASPDDITPVFVKVNGHTVTVLEKGKPGEKQEAKTHLSTDALADSANTIKIIVDSGLSLDKQRSAVELGHFEIRGPRSEILWRPLTGHNGRPIGRTFNIYQYDKTGGLETERVQFSPFLCNE